MCIRDRNFIEKWDKSVIIPDPLKKDENPEWILNPEIEWMSMDINSALFYVISNEWLSDHCRKEWENKNKNVYNDIGAVLQFICNFDLQSRARKYTSYGRSRDNNLFTQLSQPVSYTHLDVYKRQVARHVDNLDMYVHEYSPEIVFEFDEIQQIQNIDGLFLGNVSGLINQKICEVLNCTEDEINNIVILSLIHIFVKFDGISQI